MLTATKQPEPLGWDVRKVLSADLEWDTSSRVSGPGEQGSEAPSRSVPQTEPLARMAWPDSQAP